MINPESRLIAAFDPSFVKKKDKFTYNHDLDAKHVQNAFQNSSNNAYEFDVLYT